MKQFIYLLVIGFVVSCGSRDSQFVLIHAEDSGITFSNTITESDSFNILTYEYIYNGGGVGLGDFNNDGLVDVYLTGNMVSNELYLNQGSMQFTNVTSISGTSGEGRWSSGVNVIDINSDGLLDMYICATAHPQADNRRNLLYINTGVDKDGVPRFREMAGEYNLADTMHTTQAAFLDFDGDGDLDVFLANNKMIDASTPNDYRNRAIDIEKVDRLYRNDWSDSLGHPVFVDVSEVAGIVHAGFSLGVNTSDINMDGHSDIYVTNDYLTTDLLYINKGDGTFVNMADKYFRHTSYSAMGNDVIDFTNDGRPEVVALDMLPDDNYRRKTMLGPNNYTNYINNETFGYQYQFIKNTFHLNQGNDPVSEMPVFSDVSFLAGVSSTDWSWAPLAADFDNDGLRDLIITNGFPKDITDRDFIDYHAQAKRLASSSFMLQLVPSVKLKNYAYRNMGDLSFEDVTSDWGIEQTSFSNGAAYADMDNDGDLDYIVNNINDPAHFYKNLAIENKSNGHWIAVGLDGIPPNTRAIGAKVFVYAGNVTHYYEKLTTRGYLSSSEGNIHFGLGTNGSVDSIVVVWPDGRRSIRRKLEIDRLVVLAQTDTSPSIPAQTTKKVNYLEDRSEVFDYVHKESDYIDFNVQPLLLHKYSQFGPSVSVVDVDSDGLEDLYVGGSYPANGVLFRQYPEGKFTRTDQLQFPESSMSDQMGVLFFDADGDGDMDVYLAPGGYEFPKEDPKYTHLFLLNEDGQFISAGEAIPTIRASGSCVRAADYDGDGDLDLFVGSRLIPKECPVPATSYLLRNDLTEGKARFTIVNDAVLPVLNDFGLVSDALWTDFDNDGWPDLLVASEWSALRLFRNVKGAFSEVTKDTGLDAYVGWWNSLAGADFDNDGDIDYLAGNHGHNTLLKATTNEPVSIYYADFDNNGTLDMIPTSYFKDLKGKMREYPYFGRMDVQKEMISVKRKYLKYSEYGVASAKEVIGVPLETASILHVNYLSTSYVENLGNGKFKVRELPVQAQLAPAYGMVAEDVTGDGNLDAIIIGNDYGTEVLMGRSDASVGALLIGDGKGSFLPVPMEASGLNVNGDAKGLVQLRGRSGNSLLIAAQNRASLKCYLLDHSQAGQFIDVPGMANRVSYETVDGTRSQEVYHGSGFLSQSSRRVFVPKGVEKVVVTFTGGRTEVIEVTR